MKFGRLGPTRPESVPRLFSVYRHGGVEFTTRGREVPAEHVIIAEVRCIMARANPEEQEQFNQLGKLVTHSILQRGSPIATENDVFVLMKGAGKRRVFRVQAVHNKGELDIDTVYYCEERSDVP